MDSWINNQQYQALAYALILMRADGLLCVFYGDLYGLHGPPEEKPMEKHEKMLLARKWFRVWRPAGLLGCTRLHRLGPGW